jgi:hypothetical protein
LTPACADSVDAGSGRIPAAAGIFVFGIELEACPVAALGFV